MPYAGFASVPGLSVFTCRLKLRGEERKHGKARNRG